MDALFDFLSRVRSALEIPLLKVGDFQLTLWALLHLIVLLLLLFYLSGKLRTWIVDWLLVRSKMDFAGRQVAGSIVRYLVVVIGFLIIVQTAGIDLTTFNVLAGAVGIGVGFGLQNIANNFISGVVILLERPIKIGDRIDVGGVEGAVASIGARSTTVITNDNIAIIIPNAKFVSENVVNWSYTDPKVRFKIPVSVAYGTDVRLVEKLLLEVASENSDVLKDPAPTVQFREFGDSGLLFEVRAWTSTLLHRKGKLFSDLNFAIYEKFTANKIEIPFPQRDLHIRTIPPDMIPGEDRNGD